MKRILLVLSLMALVSCLFALSVSAVEIDGIDYTLKDTEAHVNTGNRDCELTEVVIPETVTHEGVTYTVTKVYSEAFRSNATVKKIVTPSTLVSIGTHAFREMSALEEIILNASAEFTAFTDAEVYGCRALKRADLSGLVGLIDMGGGSTYDHTFVNCVSLTEVILPDSLEIIGTNAFNGCSSLANIDLPDGLTTIRGSAFASCAFTAVKIPETVTYIGDYAFQGCRNLESLNIPVGVTYFGCNNFQYTKVTKVVFPSTVTGMGKDMFNSVQCIGTVVIGNPDVSGYNGTVFSGCGPLTTVFFAGEASVLKEKYSAFKNHEEVSYEQYLINLRNPDFEGYAGKILVYGVEVCEHCGDVDVAEYGFIFDSLLAEMYMGAQCPSCGSKAVSEAFAPAFVDLGYSSACINGVYSIIQGFKVNYESIDVYSEKTGAELVEIGVIAVAGFRVDGTVFNDDGTAKDGVVHCVTAARNDVISIKVTGLSAEATLPDGTSLLDAKLHACAYVKVGDEIYYISEGYIGTSLGNAVSYNDIAE